MSNAPASALFSDGVLANIVTLPLIVTLLVATGGLVIIATRMRQLRTAGVLTATNGTIGGSAAALVVAVALMASVGLGPVANASASASDTVVEPGIQSVATHELEGFQLPTE